MSYSSLLPLLAMQGMGGGDGTGVNPAAAPPQGMLAALMRRAQQPPPVSPLMSAASPGGSPMGSLMRPPGAMPMAGGMTPGAPPVSPGAMPQQPPGLAAMMGQPGMFSQLLAGLGRNQQGVAPQQGQDQSQPWFNLPQMLSGMFGGQQPGGGTGTGT